MQTARFGSIPEAIKFMKRIFLFVLTNLAVVFVIYIALRLLGVDRRLDQSGSINFTTLPVLSAVIGFAGSLVSLAMSKRLAKRMVGARAIENPVGPTGLLRDMSRDKADAVSGQEITRIADGDVVTLALIQGAVNTFVIFFAKLFGFFADRVLLKNEGRNGIGIGAFVAEIAAQLVLGVMASIIVMWFSRQREFRAEKGGAILAGRGKMIAALERLKINHEQAAMPEKIAAFGISGGRAFEDVHDSSAIGLAYRCVAQQSKLGVLYRRFCLQHGLSKAMMQGYPENLTNFRFLHAHCDYNNQVTRYLRTRLHFASI
jgi:heat shock protein HtpX